MRCSAIAAGVAALTLQFSAGAIDEINISDGGITFELRNLEGGRLQTSAGLGDLFVPVSPVQDQLFQNWWWYRTATDDREYALSNQVQGNDGANWARLVYDEPANDGATPDAVRFEIEYTVAEINVDGRSRAMVVMGWKMRNLLNVSQAVQLFNYNDMRLGATSANDTARVDGADDNIQRIRERSIDASYVASSTNHVSYEIDAWPVIRGYLTDGDVDNPANLGSPFGPGNYTGVNRWGALLAPAGSDQDTLVGSVVLMVEGETCRADWDGNGVVNAADVGAFLSEYFQSIGPCP